MNELQAGKTNETLSASDLQAVATQEHNAEERDCYFMWFPANHR